jgi:ribosomal protein L29
MKKKEIKEIQGKSVKELRALEKKAREELARLKVELKAGKLKNIGLYITKKVDLARIKTILKERQTLNEKN